jgi:hypothetical protein
MWFIQLNNQSEPISFTGDFFMSKTFIVEKRISITGLWSVYMPANSERVAIIRADQFKQQHPSMHVRVVDSNGFLFYQA